MGKECILSCWQTSLHVSLCTLAQIGRNPGLQAIWEDEKQRRREKCESSQIKTPESQGKKKQKAKKILCSYFSESLNGKQAEGRNECIEFQGFLDVLIHISKLTDWPVRVFHMKSKIQNIAFHLLQSMLDWMNDNDS